LLHDFSHIDLEDEDIIDETLNFFRANVFFRNFDVRGSADRTMIYLTLYTHQCLVKCEKIEDRATGNDYDLLKKGLNLF
jgi:hypothetical protein